MSKTTAVATLYSKTDAGNGQTALAFSADYNDERNKAWAKYTPGLGVQMTVLESVGEQFEQGKRYLLTFEDADVEPREIPEGYEPAENSNAKDHVLATLEVQFDKQGIDLGDGDSDDDPDLIGMADAVVEALLAAGVIIPEDLPRPAGFAS